MQSLACFHARSVPEEHELPVTSPSRMEATAACIFNVKLQVTSMTCNLHEVTWQLGRLGF